MRGSKHKTSEELHEVGVTNMRIAKEQVDPHQSTYAGVSTNVFFAAAALMAKLEQIDRKLDGLASRVDGLEISTGAED